MSQLEELLGIVFVALREVCAGLQPQQIGNDEVLAPLETDDEAVILIGING